MENVIICVSVLLTLGSLIWSATVYTRHKAALAETSYQHNLHYENYGDSACIWGNVGACSIQIKTEMVNQYRKGEHISVLGELKFHDAPRGLQILTEGTSAGLRRMGNKEEIEFDHPDFDNAFWVQADDPELARDYLTEDRRVALLHWLRLYGSGEIRDGVLNLSASQLELMDVVGPMLSQFLGLAYAFDGNPSYHRSTAELKEGWVATQRLRMLAFWTGLMALFFWVLPLETHMPDWVLHIDEGLMALSALTAGLALMGRRKLVLVSSSILGVTTSLGLLAVASGLYLTQHTGWAVGAIVFAAFWLIVWMATCFQLKALR